MSNEKKHKFGISALDQAGINSYEKYVLYSRNSKAETKSTVASDNFGGCESRNFDPSPTGYFNKKLSNKVIELWPYNGEEKNSDYVKDTEKVDDSSVSSKGR
ncbi:MAG: hypothetical protein K0R98_78 [Rickettsiaceae bacterium]|jgi:hypothetical protein|nr:hypothetical protein [Rickettsiaceae bacterium]